MTVNPLKKILFICVENFNRSQMADAFAKRQAEGKSEVFSAGSKPSGKINPRAIKFMKEIRYDLSTQSSKSLSEIETIEFDYVITMGCGDACPWVKAKHRINWQLEDPKEKSDEEFRQIRDEIKAKMASLLNSFNRFNTSSSE